MSPLLINFVTRRFYRCYVRTLSVMYAKQHRILSATVRSLNIDPQSFVFNAACSQPRASAAAFLLSKRDMQSAPQELRKLFYFRLYWRLCPKLCFSNSSYAIINLPLFMRSYGVTWKITGKFRHKELCSLEARFTITQFHVSLGSNQSFIITELCRLRAFEK